MPALHRRRSLSPPVTQARQAQSAGTQAGTLGGSSIALISLAAASFGSTAAVLNGVSRNSVTRLERDARARSLVGSSAFVSRGQPAPEDETGGCHVG